MPTIVGLRRRGYTPEAIRDFCERIGVAKNESIDRRRAARALRARGPEPARAAGDGRAAAAEGRHRELSRGQVEELEAVNNPEDPSAGHAEGAVLARALHRAGRLPRGSRRRSSSGCRPGSEVRLRYAYFIKCDGVVKDADGDDRRAALHLRSATRGGDAPDGRKVKATIHWVSAAHARAGRGAAVRPAVHERAARRRRQPTSSPSSTRTRSRCSRDCVVEPSLAGAAPGDALPVRAPRLLLRRSRLDARRAWSSTARSRCATRGRRSRRARSRHARARQAATCARSRALRAVPVEQVGRRRLHAELPQHVRDLAAVIGAVVDDVAEDLPLQAWWSRRPLGCDR